MRGPAENPNVMCKLSGMITGAVWRNWDAATFRPDLEIAWDAFGPQCLMFGSDWPVSCWPVPMQVKQMFRDFLRGQEREAVFGGNAARFCGLKVEHGLTA
jgi:L-fuconolactonase